MGELNIMQCGACEAMKTLPTFLLKSLWRRPARCTLDKLLKLGSAVPIEVAHVGCGPLGRGAGCAQSCRPMTTEGKD